MAGIWDGLRVLDLTRGIAGPMTAMMFADHGADVVRIEPPGGDGYGHLPGYAVWNRGKRRVELDLRDEAGRAEFLAAVAHADVVIESYRAGVTERLGIDSSTLLGINPALVAASITGYGRDNPHADRPGIEWLVTTRTGMQWDQRGYYGTRMEHIMGLDTDDPGFDVPDGAEQTGSHEGPIYLAVPWASIGAALLATTGISAALYVRERTGRGQAVETSLLQAVLMENAMGWQHVERMHPSYRLWYFDRRAPKGFYQAADGTWLHQWAPHEHEFIRATAAELTGTSPEPLPAPADDSYEALVELEARAHVATSAAMATLPRSEWIERFAAAGKAAQPVLSPEEALFDEPLAREGVIVELDDPEHGPIRQVGHTYGFDRVENPPLRPRAATIEPLTEAVARWTIDGAAGVGPTDAVAMPDAPLLGVVVLDFGLAIAGPYGPQILADLGATVIKVTTNSFSLTDAIYVGSSQGKQAIAIDLKDPRGKEIAQRLIARADVVHHNMRGGVAERLGIDYESARAINPSIVYCHTRGYEQDGPRTHLPGNDQMGNALAGTEYEGGGTHHGTPPLWYTIALGDTGNGVLSASAVVQALLHRERTGEGQFVHTSILNVCMLFNSYTFARPDGTGPDRDRIDAGQYGFDALRRLYAAADGWICIHVRCDAEFGALASALEVVDLAADDRFADATSRATHDAELAALLGARFAERSAEEWWKRLDDAGVPCEIADEHFARHALEDPQLRDAGWVVSNPHPHLGTVQQVGTPFRFSASDAVNRAGAPITGQHTREILEQLGYQRAEIDALVDDGVVVASS